MELRGASALVTGAGRGIGRAIARGLAAAGASVTAVSRTAAELEALAGEITGQGGRATAFPGDVRDPGVCAAAVARAVEAHGGLQILVNNAGVGSHAPVIETSDEEWDRVFDTNLTANPIAGMAAYCASKAALDHFAHCLMLEVRQQGVKVTTIAPGSVATGFGGEGDKAESWKLQPGDVADTIVDLLRTRDAAHLSRVEMRPLRPPKRA